MNYQLHYEQLVAKSQAACRRKLKRGSSDYVYYEQHHIVSKCLGGDNAKENLVLLTAREHFMAHLLLAKANPGNLKLAWAVIRLSNDGRRRSKCYQVAKAIASDAVTLKHLEASAKGKHTFQKPEIIERIAKINRLRGELGTHQSQTAANRNRASVVMSRTLSETVTCTHCFLSGSKINMSRYHFDNCRLLLSPGAACDLSEAASWLPCSDCDMFFKSKHWLGSHRNKKHNKL